MKVRVDYVKHVFVGLAFIVLFGAVGILFDGLLGGLMGGAFGQLFGSITGMLKEEYDRKRPQRHSLDGWDAYATSLGAACGNFGFSIVLVLQL